MDVLYSILLFTITTSSRTTWGAIILNNGEMESFVGSGTNELESLFDGLTQCLGKFLGAQIVIRSRNETVLQLEKRTTHGVPRDGRPKNMMNKSALC